MQPTVRAMDGSRTRIELDITTIARKRGRGSVPTHYCSNCKCTRYYPCHCMLGKDARKAEFKRIKGIKK